ncbi:uncharacterized protein LOC125651893 [Ostrea edulis]|uniref:uncharacterized protein LOC125651893 n=1 Tax=Ostrea edulis TaxID=37623 RepID=UPI0024AF21A7|nr:uncharacterized protein LOC125651893 [Ostrea edulis]
MVHKTTKCGVHSGNTLRASHSKYTKTFRKQSCLVRKIKNSANLRLLQDFGIATDDVAYSLSKKGRWVLPTVLKELILFGGFSDDDPNVQLTEKHKLKKTANCLGFYASKGPIKKAVPSKKRYFNVSSLKKMSSSPSEKKEEVVDGEEVDEHLEPEIQVEVYHPTPISSSITHKKYIKPFHCSDEQVSTKSRKPRRHRTQIKFDLECIEDDYKDDIWEEEEEEEEEEEVEVYNEYLFQAEFQRPQSFFTAADLLKSATKTRQIFNNSNKTHRKHNNDEMKPKAKIVNLHEEDLNSNSDHQEKTTKVSTNSKPLGFEQIMVPRKIVLPTAETQPEFLKFIYGDKYLECNTFPRTFVINITDEVKAMMKRDTRMMHKTPWLDSTTILIFTYDIYTAPLDGEDVFDVYLNVNINAERLELSTLFDYYAGSLESVIGQAVSHIKSYGVTQFAQSKHCPKGKSEMEFNALKACRFPGRTSTSTEEGIFEEAILSHAERNSLEEDFGLGFEALPPKVCYICFEEMDEYRPGIAMGSCGHWFCRECWREHLLHQNFSRLLCPEFKCGKEVHLTLILQILNITDVRKYLTRKKENLIQSQYKYCPNEKCGRIISASLTSKPTNVVCECGFKFCPKCLKFPHWPVSCGTSHEYWNLLKEKGISMKSSNEDLLPSEVQVRGKSCPKCNQFIEKEGGCYSMECICGINFCWGCRGIFGVNHIDNDNCQQWKHGDLHKTVKRRLKTDPLLSLKFKEEPALIQAAVKQRSERALSKTLLMKRKSQSWCLKIRTLGQKSSTKVANLLAGCVSTDNIFSNFDGLLRKMIKLYLEMRHLAEYTAVFAQQQNSQSRKSLNCVLDRMDDLATQIYMEFQMDTNSDLPSLVVRMLDIKDHCMRSVTGLVKIIDEMNLD